MKRRLVLGLLVIGIAGCSQPQITAPQYKAGTSVEVFTRNAIRHIESCQSITQLHQIEEQYLKVELRLDNKAQDMRDSTRIAQFHATSSSLHSCLGNMARLRAMYLGGVIKRETLMKRYPFSHRLSLDNAAHCEKLRRGFAEAPLP